MDYNANESDYGTSFREPGGYFLFDKKGTTSVFLTMILASMIFAVCVFNYEASQLAGRSYADAVLELSGRSILSEYDTQLQQCYGIFAVHIDQSEAEKKIKYYSDYSFHDNALKEGLRQRKYMDPLNLELESVQVDLKGYSITDTDLFEKQILERAKDDLLKNIVQKEKNASQGESNIKLRNQQVINSLPSYGYKKSTLDIKQLLKNGIPSLKEIKGAGTDTFYIDEYIMSHFLNHCRGNETRDTFFQNEVEYLLAGNYDDQENYDDVRTDLFVMRTSLNIAHIYKDSKKKNEVLTMAQILTPEAAPLTQAVIAGLWAAAEAENDMRRLEDGKMVPLIKKRQQWALDLENAVKSKDKQDIKDLAETVEENDEEENLDLGTSMQSKKKKTDYAEPNNKKGIDYESYLRILLFLEKREIKLLRCMDLIQLNMKGSYNQDFDLKQCYGGFEFEAVISDRTYTYIQQY